MADSDFVFEKGKAIRVGSHGDHDFVFSAGNRVVDKGKSPLVFEAGTGIGGADIIDDFNDGDMAEYQDTAGVQVVTSPTFEGSHALEMTSDNEKPTSFSGDGLDRYPQRGDFFRCYIYLPSGLGPADELKWGPIWGAQTRSTSTTDNSTGGYELECRYDEQIDGSVKSDIYITRDTQDQGDIDVDTAEVDWSNYEDEWLYLDIDWNSTGNAVSLHREADDSQIASVSHNNTDVDFGGVGYFTGKVAGPLIDFYHFP